MQCLAEGEHWVEAGNCLPVCSEAHLTCIADHEEDQRNQCSYLDLLMSTSELRGRRKPQEGRAAAVTRTRQRWVKTVGGTLKDSLSDNTGNTQRNSHYTWGSEYKMRNQCLPKSLKINGTEST